MTAPTLDPRVPEMRLCRRLTRRHARNFYYGLKLLPEPKRSALYAIYAWMRRADDIADDGSDAIVARGRLAAFRAATDTALRGTDAAADDPVLRALAQTVRAYALEPAPFRAMLDGQAADLEGSTYATFEDLRVYCERVASSVGRVCVSIWGTVDGTAATESDARAAERGIAFQLTNILRDLIADFDEGRVYLPRDELRAHDLTPAALRAWDPPECCRAFVGEQAARARRFYESSAPLDAMVSPDCRSTLWAMTRIYRGLLDRIARDPSRVVRASRVRLPALQKAAIALAARWGKGGGHVQA